MRATLGRLGVLVLLAASVTKASGQPVPVPADKAAGPTPQEHKLLDRAKDLAAEAVRQYRRGDVPTAILLSQESLGIRRTAYPREKYPRGHPNLARAISNLAWMYRDVGDYNQAELLFREALEMRRSLHPKKAFPNGHFEIMASLYELARLHEDAADFGKAEPLYREALDMARALFPRADDPLGHMVITTRLGNLAGLYRQTGEYGKAEPLVREALKRDRARYPKEKYPRGRLELAASLNNLGILYHSMGEYGKAEPLLREALEMQRALYPTNPFPSRHRDLANSIAHLASLYQSVGEYDKAEPLYREALDRTRALYPKERFPGGHHDLARCINNLAVVQLQLGQDGKARPLLREALALCRALFPREKYAQGHPELATVMSNLAGLHHAAGEYGQAAPLLREALDMNRGLALRHADLAAEAEALNYLRTFPPTRDALLSATRHLPAAAAVYDALWDTRAALTRLQERRHRALMASRDKDTADLAGQLTRTRLRLSGLLLKPGRDAGAHRDAVQKLTDAKEDLEKRIARKLKLAPTAVAVTSPKRLAEALPDGTAFVDFYRYIDFAWDLDGRGKKREKRTPRYVAFVIDKGKDVARVELKEAAPIDAAWAAWHQALTAERPNARAEREAAARLAHLIWSPLRAALPAGCRAVYLTPDAALAQVPWAALPGPRPDTVLLDVYAVCLVPHGPWLLERLHEKVAPRAGGTLLVYGGIDYQGAPAAGAKDRGPRELELVGDAALPAGAGRGLHWAALPGTAREQERVVALAREALRDPPIVRSGRAASTDQLLEDLPRARYAHLATHGFFADPRFRSYLQVDPALYERRAFGERRTPGGRSPLVLSGLVLAGANRRGGEAAPDRGIVTAEGLIGLRLEGLELAVLSACDTGLGESGGGEGVFGLQRAFHVAGCKNVVASLWQVDDEATAALMGLFYHNLWQEGVAPAEALRRAQLTLYRHPERIPQLARARGPDFDRVARRPAEAPAGARAPARLWAGFVLSGTGR